MSRNVQTGFARAGDGVGLHWRHYPVNRPRSRVILIHALAMDGSTWAEVIDALPEDVSAIAADCRGHGISDAGKDDFTLTQFADDIAAVLDAAGWDRAVIAGCSMGGCVAQAVAVHHPDRTAGLVLIDTTASYGPNAGANWAARADKAGASGLQSLLPFQRKRWFSDAFRSARPDRVAETEAVFLRTDPSAYARSCAMLGSADLRGALVGLCGPAAVLVGSDDQATTPGMARDLVAAIPGATLQILEGARHFTPIERPAAIAQAIATVVDRSAQVRL